MNNLKLLIKFPTRSRPDKFFNVLDLYYKFLECDNYEFIISCDIDDITMNNDIVKEKFKLYPNLNVFFENNKNKVQAINNNLSDKQFDILLLASDDMIPEYKGYDNIIRKTFNMVFPDLDGVVWFDDGFQGKRLNTLTIIGFKYYKRFNYIYNPEYKSFYCDNEFMQVSKLLNKVVYIEKCIIRHQHYSIINTKPDDLYKKNDSLYNYDFNIFQKRAARKFDIVMENRN